MKIVVALGMMLSLALFAPITVTANASSTMHAWSKKGNYSMKVNGK